MRRGEPRVNIHCLDRIGQLLIGQRLDLTAEKDFLSVNAHFAANFARHQIVVAS